MENMEMYMRRAIELAKRGIGAVNPNPFVGAVIVKDGEILAEGWHERYGELHAERNAIKHFYEKYPDGNLEGATIFVTLEPCCHYGKTPPCTEAIIENKFARVVIGSRDINPLVAGKGVEILRNAGIDVVTDFMRAECDELNYVFFHYISTKMPYVVMKYAMTLDGKIATITGKSKWITGEKSRENVHKDRNRYMAIMAGLGTVIADNPMLNCRLEDNPDARNPIRIICDTNLRTPLDCRIVQTADEIRTILATACTDKEKQKTYMDKGCEIVEVPLSKAENKSIDLQILMIKLGGLGIDSVLLEGGATLNFSALKAGIVNRVQAYIAPKIFGGSGAKTPVGGEGFKEVSDAVELVNPRITDFGNDILFEAEVKVDLEWS
jgi:diaminohydroxyphosphoribosylaminopyrimidine deaminase/5-amino-6-(5-phosphoribosylamino)uracil reductase